MPDLFDRLAERLLLDRETLITLILNEAGDQPHLTVAMDSMEIPNPDQGMVERRNTGLGVMIGTGPVAAFEITIHPDDVPGSGHTSLIKAVTVNLK